MVITRNHFIKKGVKDGYSSCSDHRSTGGTIGQSFAQNIQHLLIHNPNFLNDCWDFFFRFALDIQLRSAIMACECDGCTQLF